MGSWPATSPLVGVAGGMDGVAIDWTVANVSGEPPPKSKVRDPDDRAAASCTGSASEPAGATAPLAGLMVDTVATDDPEGVMPPSTVSPPALATTDSRDSGALICHGSTPASMEPGPVERAVCTPWPATVVVGEVDVPPEHEAKATPPIRATRTTARMATRRRRWRMRRARRDRSVTGTESRMVRAR